MLPSPLDFLDFLAQQFAQQMGQPAPAPKPGGGITHPLISHWLFGGYLLLLLGLGIFIAWLRRGSWQKERDRVHDAIAEHLRLSSDDAARSQILALVPCVQWKTETASGQPERQSERLWLCFHTGGWFVVFSSSGKITELSGKRVERLSLVDSIPGKDFVLKLRTGTGFALLEVPRLDDMTRVINLLIRQGTPLGYEAA